jgi:formate hydrogenlyase transcriptional activator
MSNDAVSETRLQMPFADAGIPREAEQLFSAYFGSSVVGFCMTDSNLRFIAINDALAEINGLPAADHIGRTLREVLGDLAPAVEVPFLRVLSTGKPVIDFEIGGMLPTRSEAGQWIGHYFPIQGLDGVVSRVVGLVVEVTERKKLEEALHSVNLKLTREMARLRVLVEVNSVLASNWNLHEVFPIISSRIRRVLRHEYARFELHDPGTGLLVRQAEDFPLGRGVLTDVDLRMNNSPGGRALQAGHSLTFSQEQILDFEGQVASGLLAEGLKSLCSVPLLRPRGALGVFVLGSTRQNAFQPEDVTLLNQVAAQFAVAIENHRAATEIEVLKDRLTVERRYLEGEITSEGTFAQIIGESPALKQVLGQVATVASSEATVMILGETGTGKELVARAIHDLSPRKEGKFIKLNCAAIPTGLLESELFGHEKGAFTGAINQKIGRMELANGGTLFLDEVGEIPLELQPKLLRVLQDQEFERLGSNRTIAVDLRLVAATNRDLPSAIAEHQFRQDLFYRLNVFPIRLPALRERAEDIPLLIRHFVAKFSARMGRVIETVPTESMHALMAWTWPGNVRELENLMERSVILSEGSVLQVPLSELRTESPTPAPDVDHSLDNAEREHILLVLRETGGLISGPDGAAHRLGLKRTTLHSKMQRLKITRRDYFGPKPSGFRF